MAIANLANTNLYEICGYILLSLYNLESETSYKADKIFIEKDLLK